MITPDRHLDEATCADLVLGLLPRLEGEAWRRHTSLCSRCEARLRAHAGASVRAQVEARALAGPGSRPLEAERPGVARVTRLRPHWLDASIVAAAAAVLLLVLMPRATKSPREAVRSEWLASPREMVRMRAEGALDPNLAQGFEAYGDRDLTGSVRLLRSAHATAAAEQARRLYLGHALLADGQPIEALAWLKSVDLAQLPEPWKAQATRALVAACRANAEHDRADSLERALQR